MLRITLLGRIPSKKNAKIMICRGSRPMLLPSAKYKEWHEEQSLALMCIERPKQPLDEVCVTMTIYAPDKRKADLSNKAESVMDLLVDNKIIEDDSWFNVPELVLRFGGIDRKKPRVEICID